jgi:hypothetical protein
MICGHQGRDDATTTPTGDAVFEAAARIAAVTLQKLADVAAQSLEPAGVDEEGAE